MIEYRLYFHSPDGHIIRRIEFESPNDEKALAHVKQYMDGKALELWSGARFISRIEPEGH